MPVTCPKCHHVRSANATNPEWECPACGICYAKYRERHAQAAQSPNRLDARAPLRAVREEEAEAKHRWNTGLLSKLALLAFCGWALPAAIQYHSNALADKKVAAVAHENALNAARLERLNRPDPAMAIANEALEKTVVDASMLPSLSGRLISSCANNRYRLSESACIARVQERKESCAASTAQRYPDRIHNVQMMGTVTREYVDCIFKG